LKLRHIQHWLLRFFALLLRWWGFTLGPCRFLLLIFGFLGFFGLLLFLILAKCFFFEFALAFFSLLLEQCLNLVPL
jgi:hypothetical protein